MQRTSQAKMVLNDCYTLCEQAFGKIVVVFADPPPARRTRWIVDGALCLARLIDLMP
jgi:hypothetical protein